MATTLFYHLNNMQKGKHTLYQPTLSPQYLIPVNNTIYSSGTKIGQVPADTNYSKFSNVGCNTTETQTAQQPAPSPHQS